MYEKRMLRIIRPIVHILQEMSFRSDPALKAIPDNELLKTLWGAGEQGERVIVGRQNYLSH